MSEDQLDRPATPEEIEMVERIDLPPQSKRLRRSYIFARDDHDFYVEPPWCSERLLAVEPFAGLIWDPAAGSGTISRAARAAGLPNFASDIADRGCAPRQNFLIASAPAEVFNVVTNPPFRLARAFVERALTLGAVKTAIIFPTARLNAARWLKPLPLAKIYLLTPRPSMPPGEVIARGEKPGGGKTDFCWLMLDRTHSGPPTMWWLHRDGPLSAENNKRPETLLEHAPDQSEGVTTGASIQRPTAECRDRTRLCQPPRLGCAADARKEVLHQRRCAHGHT